jgi:hypothetical protein
MNATEWWGELRRLRAAAPGLHDTVAMTYWRAFLHQARSGLTVLGRPPSMKYLTPRERCEANQGHKLAAGTQIMRCGRRSYYVIEPDPGPRAPALRVY